MARKDSVVRNDFHILKPDVGQMISFFVINRGLILKKMVISFY